MLLCAGGGYDAIQAAERKVAAAKDTATTVAGDVHEAAKDSTRPAHKQTGAKKLGDLSCTTIITTEDGKAVLRAVLPKGEHLPSDASVTYGVHYVDNPNRAIHGASDNGQTDTTLPTRHGAPLAATAQLEQHGVVGAICTPWQASTS